MAQYGDKEPGASAGARRATGDDSGMMNKGSQRFRPGARPKLSCALCGEKAWSYFPGKWG